MPEEDHREGLYLMPSGKVASVDLGDGQVSLVSRAKFEECCCPPQCQWLSIFEWSCQDEEWIRVSDNWVDKVEPPDTVIDQGDCVRLVYGDSGDCELEEDERPEVPPDFEGDPPEEPEECCVPGQCPPNQPEMILFSGYTSEIKRFSGENCDPENILSRIQIRQKGEAVLFKGQFGCIWSNLVGVSSNEPHAVFERRTFNFGQDKWNDWVEQERDVSLSLITFLGPPFFWEVSVQLNDSIRVVKRTGLTPVGGYGAIVSCSSSTISSASWRASCTIS